MANSFQCRVITPQDKILDDEATQAILPAWDGLLGILPGRAPLVTRLGAGELRLEFPNTGGSDGGSRTYYVESGFARMVDNSLEILAEVAIPAEQLQETEAKAELAEAEARTTDGLSADDAERVRLERERARAKLRVAQGFRERGRAI